MERASAALTTYLDRSFFEAALSTSTTIDFEDVTPGGLGSSVSFSGLTYTNSGGVWATTGFGAPSVQVGDQNNQTTVISLSSGYNAFGLDLGRLFGPGQVPVQLTDGGGGLIYSATLSVSDNDNLGTTGTTFFGFINDAGDIGSMILYSDGFPTTDNVTFGNTGSQASLIPETSSVLPVGMIVFALASRRRRAW